MIGKDLKTDAIEGKRPIKMKVYYLDEDNINQEINRLQSDTSEQTIAINNNVSESEKEITVKELKQQIIELVQVKKKNIKIFSQELNHFLLISYHY
ncbi:hypothetical protein CV093_11825 [Oceanobacillus sp. 143]|nr:hypothetical protein CV093_11825 [Oceanobacillus sp. 143]